MDNEILDVSDISWGGAKAYRDFMFPAKVANKGHNPHFSLMHSEEWIAPEAYRVFAGQEKELKELGDSGEDVELSKLGLAVLKAYKKFILTEQYRGHPFFDLDVLDVWFKPSAFRLVQPYLYTDVAASQRPRSTSRAGSEYMSESDGMATSDYPPSTRASSRMSMYSEPEDELSTRSLPTASRRVPAAREVIEIHDSSSEDEEERLQKQRPAAKSLRVLKSEPSQGTIPKARAATNPIKSEILDVDLDLTIPESLQSRRTKRPRSPSPQSKFSRAERKMRKAQGKFVMGKNENSHLVKITNGTLMDDLQFLSPTDPIPFEKRVAYCIDFEGFKLPERASKKDELPAHTYLRKKSQDSWSGSTGLKRGNVNVYNLLPDDPDPEATVFCRRPHLDCNGVKVCPYFDESTFEGASERWEEDLDMTNEILEKAREANEAETDSVKKIVLRFVLSVKKSKCHIKCSGYPVVRKRAMGADKNGKTLFVGCSAWRKSEQDQHIYHAIPWNVPEDMFQKILDSPDNELPAEAAEDVNARCTFHAHPSSGITECPHSHVVNGRVVSATLRLRACPAKLVLLSPVDWDACERVITYLRHPHNHPAFPPIKPTVEDESLLGRSIKAAGFFGLSTEKLLKAPTTIQLCDGKALTTLAPAYARKRRIRSAIKALKDEEYPFGFDWFGLVMEYLERESLKPMSERYIHSTVQRAEVRLAITANATLLGRIHFTRVLSCDFSFKRTFGDFDEWKVVGMDVRLNRRITYLTGYCDRSTTEAFTLLFSEVFRVVREVTGAPLRFRAFWPQEASDISEARLLGVLLDAEVAQVKGLAASLVQYVAEHNPESDSLTSDRMDLTMMVLKFCALHFDRNVEKLKCLPREKLERLKSFRGLSTQADVDRWHADCKAMLGEHPDFDNWYKQKLDHPYILTGMNSFLSPMDEEHWNLIPRDTNLAEGAHAKRNSETGTRLSLVEAVLLARNSDARNAEELQSEMSTSLIHELGPAQRDKRASQRQDYTRRKVRSREADINALHALEGQAAKTTVLIDASKAKIAALEAELKSLRAENKIAKKDVITARIQEKSDRVKDEKQVKKDLGAELTSVKAEIKQLKAGPLKGVQLRSKATQAAADATDTYEETPQEGVEPMHSDELLHQDSHEGLSLMPPEDFACQTSRDIGLPDTGSLYGNPAQSAPHGANVNDMHTGILADPNPPYSNTASAPDNSSLFSQGLVPIDTSLLDWTPEAMDAMLDEFLGAGNTFPDWAYNTNTQGA